MTTETTSPSRLVFLPNEATDPRTVLDDQALVLASENAFPIVARREAGKDTGGLIVGGSIALALGGLTLWSMNSHRLPPAAPPLPVVARASPVFTAPPVRAVVPIAPHSLMMPSVPSVAIPQAVDRGPAPLMVYDNSVPSAVTTAATTATAVPGSAVPRSPLAAGGNDNEQFAARIGNGSAEVATAEQLGNPTTTVTQGTLIPAVLETAIDTDLPGFVRAVVSRDVKSFDGTRVLIPRSSRLIGQYKSGLAAGQTRAYVIWSRLIRPDGVSVALASPAVGFTGTSGLDGKVDSHFFKRFGAAALLTVIGGLSAIGNPSVVLAGGTSAAGVAAQGNGQIPPTIRVAQGQPIRVFTAKDLDFSTVASDALAADAVAANGVLP
ncbi:type VI secretion protein [Sphingosinicellaceae bacterium]|nr:type VI secretion protein [Sphingosinicellaceae bacterium]